MRGKYLLGIIGLIGLVGVGALQVACVGPDRTNCPQAKGPDLDFGSSPVLYDVDGTPMLALPSKDGHCYGLNRATGSLVWDTVVTDGNSRGGSIASPAAAYGKVFFGGTVNVATGIFVALDQRDGRIVWRATQSLPILGATAVELR